MEITFAWHTSSMDYVKHSSYVKRTVRIVNKTITGDMPKPPKPPGDNSTKPKPPGDGNPKPKPPGNDGPKPKPGNNSTKP